MLLVENLTVSSSFNTAFSAHTGIGTLPITYFGTKDQKDRYLPKLASGEWIGAYALTEAGSGSDAMAALTTAKLNDEKTHYILNGEKLFITNAGFADLFIIFAKIDGEHFTTFIVEKDSKGLSIGAEEKKMGIKGSSTSSVIMEDVHVPVENLLGKSGRGARIAFNILNVGRFKLAASATGGSLYAMHEAVQYAKTRVQFGQPIANFGLIQQKIANALCQVHAGRSMLYRTAGYIDQKIATLDKADPDYDSKVIDTAVREYMTECSILKVFCSEALDLVVDHSVQIHGGYGFTKEYPAERYYRDSRINRIFEGTNEINRIVIGGEVMKRAAKNQIPLFARAKALVEELMGFPELDEDEDTSFLAAEQKVAGTAKKIVQLAVGTLGKALGSKLKNIWAHEEVIGFLANLVIETYAMESAILRTRKLKESGADDSAEILGKLTTLFCEDAMNRIELDARRIVTGALEGDELNMALSGLRRIIKRPPINTIQLRREISTWFCENDDWPI
jgi:alkylation response protein AidB-like acyl-CoA dehydrogenase